jgi:hypothetical protein
MLDSSGGQRRAATAKLEVAMGLESAHPEVLEKLNKRMTIGDFERAADFLRAHDIALRAFVLVKPPFLDEDEALEWVVRSVEFAFGCGATAVSLIPTRPSNGAMDRLMEAGEFTPPRISTLERALEITLNLHRGRVFADTWDLEQFSSCPGCLEMRRQRLRTINLTQEHLPTVDCPVCQGS